MGKRKSRLAVIVLLSMLLALSQGPGLSRSRAYIAGRLKKQ